MNHSEYLQKIKELEQEFENKKIELMKEYVTANNPYKIGDKITDHIGSIIIDKMGVTFGYNNNPFATYSGFELKKDGSTGKDKSRRQVWQTNVLSS